MVRPLAGAGLTAPRPMTLVCRRTHHGVVARAATGLTGVRLRTGVAVVAGGTVRLQNGGRARTSCGHATARLVALVTIGTHYRVVARADPSLTGVRLCTGIAIVTARAVRPRRRHASLCETIGDARPDVTLIVE